MSPQELLQLMNPHLSRRVTYSSGPSGRTFYECEYEPVPWTAVQPLIRKGLAERKETGRYSVFGETRYGDLVLTEAGMKALGYEDWPEMNSKTSPTLPRKQ